MQSGPHKSALLATQSGLGPKTERTGPKSVKNFHSEAETQSWDPKRAGVHVHDMKMRWCAHSGPKTERTGPKIGHWAQKWQEFPL
jgi:hypothetical protein